MRVVDQTPIFFEGIKMNDIPVMAIDGKTLYDRPLVEPGQFVSCSLCNENHILEQSKDKDGMPGNLLYFKCGEKTFIAAVDGRFISPVATIVEG
jgi:hypothetical protein